MSVSSWDSDPIDFRSLQPSLRQRAGALLLDYLMVVLTLGIGWIVWATFTLDQGQTPAKQLLKMRVIRQDKEQAARLGWMALRELFLKMLLPLLVLFHWQLFLLVLATWLAANLAYVLGKGDNQTIWDKALKTLVIDDHESRFKRSRPLRQSPNS
ncbi:MAG: RDD family protein [bacterium]|nr:RDD family protein [bacterium]